MDEINIPLYAFPFKFGLEANILDSTGNPRYIIQASKIYNLGIKSGYNISGNKNTVLTGEPTNLKIKEFFKKASNKKEKFGTFYFWITQSLLLRPSCIVQQNFDGNVSVQNVLIKSFEIAKDLQLDFINHYSYFDDSERKNIKISKSVLAANFSGKVNIEGGEDIFDDLDLFLKLVSFSQRRKITCYGYRSIIENEFVDFYRGDVSVPKENFEHSTDDLLIDPSIFSNFISYALLAVNNCSFKGYLTDAISKAAYCKYATLESEYLSYYAAIENLVNGYKDEHSLHFILDNDLWKKFSNDLKGFIKNHDYFKHEKIKRQLVYEKLSELNRSSLASVFSSFCQFYKIDVSDLWTLGGHEYSLTNIRNLLIHGGRFEREKLNLLINANSHLKWILERCILRILSWDIEHSNISPSFLRNFISYNLW
ncbi:hypothetical protein NIES4102_38680 [Chondrocystis sp. NIES-4102]|nr:hypothetical protein NIES4102_38680 [Chondrocystis sp. NIES-4102]